MPFARWQADGYSFQCIAIAIDIIGQHIAAHGVSHVYRVKVAVGLRHVVGDVDYYRDGSTAKRSIIEEIRKTVGAYKVTTAGQCGWHVSERAVLV